MKNNNQEKMSNRQRKALQAQERARKARNKKMMSIGLALVLVVGVVATVMVQQGKNNVVYAEGIQIDKSEVQSSGFKFYPYRVNGRNLEVVAVKASDGSIRTAFNTCQVCYSSGRGFYKPVPAGLQCDNCGNIFTYDQVGLEGGGCNPVPIGIGAKIEDATTINITHETIEKNSKLFDTWKR